MNLKILFVRTKEALEYGEPPEARIVWDECCVDGNPEGWEEALKKEVDGLRNGDQWIVFDVNVPTHSIMAAFEPAVFTTATADQKGAKE